MSIVQIESCSELLAERDKLGNFCNHPRHSEDTITDDDLACFRVCLFKQLAQMLNVVVTVADRRGIRHERTHDNAGVVVLIRKDQVVSTGYRLYRSFVGLITRDRKSTRLNSSHVA